MREVLDWGMEMARGLGAAHDAGIFHRDLKPENLFVIKDGQVKILDFGLAKLDPARASSGDGSTVTLKQLTSPGQMLGTVGYMSPGQVRGEVADARSDIFAFGVILHEMLAGKRPFQGATSAETMTAILREDPPTLSESGVTVCPGPATNRKPVPGKSSRATLSARIGFGVRHRSALRHQQFCHATACHCSRCHAPAER
jgi:serine/threonine protein kinase